MGKKAANEPPAAAVKQTTINLGDYCRDTINGFEGICYAITFWLNGCVRITLKPTELDKDGKVRETETFDIEEIEVIPQKATAPAGRSTGGPMPDVPQY